jgi:hypothetical protein
MKLRIARKVLRFIRRGCYSPVQVKEAERVSDCHVVYNADGKPVLIMDHRPTFINCGLGPWMDACARGEGLQAAQDAQGGPPAAGTGQGD